MDVGDTEGNESGECEADSCTDSVDQSAALISDVQDAVGGKDCAQNEEDDDGEIESGSDDFLSEASSDSVENSATSDAEQSADRGDLMLKSRKNRDASRKKPVKQPDDNNEVVETEASEKKAEIPEGEEGYFDEDDRSQTPLQDEPDAGSEFSQSGGVDDNESIEDARLSNEKNVCSTENFERPESVASDGLAENNVPNVPDTTLERDASAEVSRKQSVRDDLGELDYEEDENQDEDAGNSVADSSGEEPGEESLNKKVNKKDLKKREKVAKEEDSEKEEGEESDEGEEKDDDHSTDGELDDDDDCEDGEIKEPGQKKPFVRPICRFYMRGNCTWGHSCRFLHPGVNDKGNYAMIDQSSFPMPGPPPPGMMIPPMGMPGGRGHLPPPPGPWMHEVPPRRLPRGPMEMGPPVVEPEHATPAPEASNESAWERGLRHAKEIRKKRKETDEDKKESSPKEERVISPLPAPTRELQAHLPPPREAFFEELPGPGPVLPVFEEDFYGRPVLPPPPEAWPFRPPFDPYDPRWGRGPPLEYPHPPHFMPPPPDFRIPERDRGHRFSPPPRFDGRRDPRFNPWFDRFHPDGPNRDQAHPMSGGDVPAAAVRGRGEEWKDPWLRSRSPKRKKNSSSRSASRGRRRYRSRSKGSFSSVSSSSYSSNSRSRSGSSSSYTSYSKSSYSRSSYSSRSSSASRSRSRSRRKPLPATTLGQSLLEKRKIHSEVHRPSSSNTNELAIGSGPLPARAPPEKKTQPSVPTQSQGKSITPRPVAPPAVQEMTKPAVSVGSPVVGAGPSSTKSLPKLSQPIPVSSRTALQPVGREVAAVFTDHEETWNDSSSISKEVEASDLKPSSPLADSADLLKDKPGSGRERSGALSRTLSGAGEKDLASNPLREIPGTRIGDRLGMSGDRSENRGNSTREHESGGRQQTDQAIEKNRFLHGHGVLAKEAAPTGKQSSNRASRTKDHGGKSKLEIGRNVMGRGLSNNSARSTSAESKRSLSSLSSSSSEHLYDDIASPISSTSSLSPDESMTKGGKNGSVPNQSPASKLKRPPSPRRVRPKTPPLQQPYPPLAAHKMEKPRVNSQREPLSRTEPRESTRVDRRGEAQRLGTRDGAAVTHRTHRPDPQRQAMPRGFLPDHATRDVRRDAASAGARERDSMQHALPGMLPSQHRVSGSRRAAGVPGSHSSGTRVSDDVRLKSSSGARNALPPPPRPSEGSMSFRAGLDTRMMSSNAKSETKVVSKSDRVASVPAHTSSVSSSRKRSAEHSNEMPSTKHMRHASDVRYPVKIPPPRKPATVSPNRSGGRSSGTSTTVALKSPVKTAPPVPPPKIPVPPPSSTSHSGNSATKPRKSTSSRREELLMQLKAVEDAIAKKRSKLQ